MASSDNNSCNFCAKIFNHIAGYFKCCLRSRKIGNLLPFRLFTNQNRNNLHPKQHHNQTPSTPSSTTSDLNQYDETGSSNGFQYDNYDDDLIAVSSPMNNNISPSLALPLNYYFRPCSPLDESRNGSLRSDVSSKSKSKSRSKSRSCSPAQQIIRKLSVSNTSKSSHFDIIQSADDSQSQASSSDYSTSSALPREVPKGLINLGNTCYMNAVIQSLYSLGAIRNFALNCQHGKSLSCSLSELFRDMKTSTSPISPANFKYAFSRYQSKFTGYNQQDAQEFLRYLINGIHEESNLAPKRPRRSPIAARTPRTASEAWTQYREIVDDSPLVDLVVGQLCSTIVCSVCQNKSNCWDPFWDLSLPLSRRRYSCRLSEVIDDFTAKETLDSDERPICETCKKATRSSKQISVCRLPRVLILHLKRFTNDGYKLTSPEVMIDKTLNFDGITYQLSACISHHGHSSSSGHYTSHCKYSSSWYHFNDDRVKDVTATFDGAKLTDAYVLFYTQQSSSDNNDTDSGYTSPNIPTNQSKL